MKKKILVMIFSMLIFSGCGNEVDSRNLRNDIATNPEIEASSEIETENTESNEVEAEENSDSEDISKKNDKDIREIPEEEFKEKCMEVTYEDMFNGDVPLVHEGACITYYGMVKDKRISDMMDITSMSFFDGLYEYDDKFMYTGPQHKEGYGYVGHDVDVYFLKDDELADNTDIKIGSMIRVYGQVIMSDTRSYIVLAKYIDIDD